MATITNLYRGSLSVAGGGAVAGGIGGDGGGDSDLGGGGGGGRPRCITPHPYRETWRCNNFTVWGTPRCRKHQGEIKEAELVENPCIRTFGEWRCNRERLPHLQVCEYHSRS